MTEGKQTTAMKEAQPKIDPFKGVVKSDVLIERMKARDTSYVRGALQWLAKHPPNPYIVPLLRAALEKFKNEI